MSIINSVTAYFYHLYLAITGQGCTDDILGDFEKKIVRLEKLSLRQIDRRNAANAAASALRKQAVREDIEAHRAAEAALAIRGLTGK